MDIPKLSRLRLKYFDLVAVMDVTLRVRWISRKLGNCVLASERNYSKVRTSSWCGRAHITENGYQISEVAGNSKINRDHLTKKSNACKPRIAITDFNHCSLSVGISSAFVEKFFCAEKGARSVLPLPTKVLLSWILPRCYPLPQMFSHGCWCYSIYYAPNIDVSPLPVGARWRQSLWPLWLNISVLVGSETTYMLTRPWCYNSEQCGRILYLAYFVIECDLSLLYFEVTNTKTLAGKEKKSSCVLVKTNHVREKSKRFCSQGKPPADVPCLGARSPLLQRPRVSPDSGSNSYFGSCVWKKMRKKKTSPAVESSFAMTIVYTSWLFGGRSCRNVGHDSRRAWTSSFQTNELVCKCASLPEWTMQNYIPLVPTWRQVFESEENFKLLKGTRQQVQVLSSWPDNLAPWPDNICLIGLASYFPCMGVCVARTSQLWARHPIFLLPYPNHFKLKLTFSDRHLSRKSPWPSSMILTPSRKHPTTGMMLFPEW